MCARSTSTESSCSLHGGLWRQSFLLSSSQSGLLLGISLERDESEYAYAGQLILQGIPPYKLAYNMEFARTYATYALIMSIFGQTIHAIHLGLLLVNAGTSALIFLIGSRLVDYFLIYRRNL